MTTNNQPTPSQPENNSDSSVPAPTTASHDIVADSAPQPQQSGRSHALNKALLRTFRGDMSKKVGASRVSHYLPKTSTAATPVQPPSKESAEPPSEAVVHTLDDDVKHLIHTKKMSLVRMAALESANESDPVNLRRAHNPWRALIIILLLLLFITISGVLAWGGYYAYRFSQGSQKERLMAPAMFFVEQQQRVDISSVSRLRMFTFFDSFRKNVRFPLGTVTELYLTNTTPPTQFGVQATTTHITASQFLHKIDTPLPESFFASLTPAYLFGLHALDSGNEPFIVLTTTSYSYAFDGMLQWESTMARSLQPLFANITKTVPVLPFRDEVYENIDTRVLYSTLGKPILVYAFSNKSTLVIATNRRTLLEILSRVRVRPRNTP